MLGFPGKTGRNKMAIEYGDNRADVADEQRSRLHRMTNRALADVLHDHVLLIPACGLHYWAVWEVINRLKKPNAEAESSAGSEE